jgi:hypothetical protein
MKLKRYLETCVRDLCFADHKMAFMSGPLITASADEALLYFV